MPKIQFDISEKLAIVQLIDAIIVADGKIHQGEIKVLRQLMDKMDFDSNFLVQARSIETAQSVTILKDMSQDKKMNLAQVLQDVAISDGFVHEKEKNVMNYVFTTIGVEK